MRISDCSSDVCSSDLTVCTWAAKKVRRPVKWTAERSESFSSDAHGRDDVTPAELAMDENGKFPGGKVETTANMGATLSCFATAFPHNSTATSLAGKYTHPVDFANGKGVLTKPENTN